VASGKELRALRGHERGVNSAQFSAHGNMVLTASLDNTARLWDVASGKELHALRGHEREVYSARFSADGQTVLTASGDNTARLWDCPECRPVETIEPEVAARVGPKLTFDERRQFGVPEPGSLTR
jgi:WD40 repeat protein